MRSARSWSATDATADIEGARRVGCASLLVFSGVATPGQLLGAPAQHRPDYLADDVSGLLIAHPPVTMAQGTTAQGTTAQGTQSRCGRWSATGRRRDHQVGSSGTGIGGPR